MEAFLPAPSSRPPAAVEGRLTVGIEHVKLLRVAYRKNLNDVLKIPDVVSFWNIEKT